MPDITMQSLGTATAPDNDEIDLVGYLLTLWRRRWVVLGFSVLGGLVMFVGSMLSPRMYEASAKLVISPPKGTEIGVVVPAISVATFRAMLESQSLAAQLVREFRLDGAPLKISAQRFLGRALIVEAPRDSNVLVLRVRLPDQHLPSKVANRLAELAIGLAERLNQDEAVHTRDDIKGQLDESRSRLDTTTAELASYRQQAQIEALKKEVEAELEQRAAVLALSVEVETERARLGKAEEELAKRQPLGSVRRTIDNSPALMEAARATTASGSSVLGLEMRDEYLSKVYEAIDQQVAESRTKLSGLERRRQELVEKRNLGAGQSAKLNLLYVHESRLARLEAESDLAQKIYLDVATRYEQVRLQVSSRTAQLQPLDPAIPSDRPASPRVLRNTLVGTMLAFVVSVLAVLVLSAVGKANVARLAASSR